MTDATERTVELNPALQRLIDERIDGIERALRGAGIGRNERKQVVEDVERQLLDMLAESARQLTRRDVLHALARLDPPEAYLSDEERKPTALGEYHRVPSPSFNHEGTEYSRLALVCFGLSLAVGFFALATLGGLLINSEGILLVGCFLTAAGAIAASATGICTLLAMLRRPQRGIGFAVAAVVIGAWILSILVCCGFAALFEFDELVIMALIMVKDLPLVLGLIWSWRASMKSRLALPRRE